MAGKIKSVTHPRVSLNILTDEDVRRIHTATLDVIQNVGVRFPSHKALDIWEAHGAKVDRQTMVIRAPGHLVEEALKKAPPAYALAARNPSQDLMMDGNHVFVGTDGCGVEVMDLHTKRLDWALRHRIPTVVWVAFCLLTVFSMTIMGYQAGLSGRRTQLPALLIGLAFSVVIVLRAILNSPSGVYSEVSQQAMVDLQNKISAK